MPIRARWPFPGGASFRECVYRDVAGSLLVEDVAYEYAPFLQCSSTD